MATKISSQRQTAHFFGLLTIAYGAALFLSVIVSLVSAPFGTQPQLGPLLGRALGGMALIAIGAAVRRAGAAGLAGSGHRMAGGMAKDALEEAGVSLGQQPPRTVVNCAACGHLNEESSKFCQECGRGM
jgi:hypothetical protein